MAAAISTQTAPVTSPTTALLRFQTTTNRPPATPKLRAKQATATGHHRRPQNFVAALSNAKKPKAICVTASTCWPRENEACNRRKPPLRPVHARPSRSTRAMARNTRERPEIVVTSASGGAFIIDDGIRFELDQPLRINEARHLHDRIGLRFEGTAAGDQFSHVARRCLDQSVS